MSAVPGCEVATAQPGSTPAPSRENSDVLNMKFLCNILPRLYVYVFRKVVRVHSFLELSEIIPNVLRHRHLHLSQNQIKSKIMMNIYITYLLYHIFDKKGEITQLNILAEVALTADEYY